MNISPSFTSVCKTLGTGPSLPIPILIYATSIARKSFNTVQASLWHTRIPSSYSTTSSEFHPTKTLFISSRQWLGACAQVRLLSAVLNLARMSNAQSRKPKVPAKRAVRNEMQLQSTNQMTKLMRSTSLWTLSGWRQP